MSKPIAPLSQSTVPADTAIIEPSSPLTMLPPELITEILMHLNTNDIKSCGLTSKLLNQFSQGEVIWKNLFYRHFQHIDPIGIQNFPQAYKDQWKIHLNCKEGIYVLKNLHGHTGFVYSTLTANGKLFSCSKDTTIKIWDLQSGKEITTLKGHRKDVCSIFFAEERLYSISTDNTIKVWDLNSHHSIDTIECDARGSKALQAANEKLYCTDNNIIKVWNLKTKTWEAPLTGHVNTIYSLTATDRELISGGWDNKIRIWNLESGICTFILEGHKGQVYSLLFENGLLYSGSNDNTIKIWDLASGKCIETLKDHGGAVFSLAIGNGLLFSSSTDGAIKIWKIKPFKCIATLKNEGSLSCRLAFAGGRLYSGSKDGMIKIWDFKAHHDKVFKEIAHQFANGNVYDIQHVNQRFLKMAKSARCNIYRKLFELANPPTIYNTQAWEKYPFYEQFWKRSMAPQKAQAIQHYLLEKVSSSNL